MDYIEENKKVYNAIAGHFSHTRAIIWDDLKGLENYAKEGDHILDLGCGNGRLYQIFQNLSISYTGVDQSEELLKHAGENFPEARFMVGNMIDIPLPDQSINIIYCIAAFHHLPTEELRLQSLQEIKRVLKPGGKVIMTNWNPLSNWAKKKVETGDWQMGEGNDHFIVPWKNAKGEIKGMRHYWLLTPEHLENIIIRSGFTLDEQYYLSRGERVEVHRGMNLVTIFHL